MTFRRAPLFLMIFLLGGGLGLTGCQRHGGYRHLSNTNLLSALGGGNTMGFARAYKPHPFAFPFDFGPHPHFRTEWWYFTGNLRNDTGRPFGFELTFFRIAMMPARPVGASQWLTNQLYMAHFAVTNPEGKHFYAWQRLSRGAVGLAGAQSTPFRVWLGDWFVRQVRVASSSGSGKRVDGPCAMQGVCSVFPWQLHAHHGAVSIALQLKPQQGVVLNGQNGLSRKAQAPGDASYYYSMPRLAAQGSLSIAGHRFKVSGTVWLDREWSTSALAPGQIGWDWFALRLSDGADLMFYRLRDRNGKADPFSAGTWVSPDGLVKHLDANAVRIDVLKYWQSPHGGRYPILWRLRIASLGIDLLVKPQLVNQELNLAVRYWEGAVSISGYEKGLAVAGDGYVELTGYAHSAFPSG